MANDQIPPGVIVEPDMTDAELAAEMNGQVQSQPAPGMPTAHELADIARRYGVSKNPGQQLTQDQLDQIYALLPAREDASQGPVSTTPDLSTLPTNDQIRAHLQQKPAPISLANEASNAVANAKDWLLSPAGTQIQEQPVPQAPQEAVPTTVAEDQVAREVAATPAEAPIAKELVKQAATPTMVEVQSSLETKLAPVRKEIADSEAQKMADTELQKYMQQEQARQLQIQQEAKRLEDSVNSEVKAKSLNEIMQNGSWGQRFLAVLALGMGAAAQAYGASKTNPALDMIDKEVERQAQKDRLNNEQRNALKAQLIQSSQNIIGAAQKRFENSITQQKLQLQFDELEQERMKALAKLQAGTQDMAALQFLTEQQVQSNIPIQGNPAEQEAIKKNNEQISKALQIYAAQKPEKAQEMVEKRVVLPNGKIKIAPASVGQVGKFNESRADIEGAKQIIDRVIEAAKMGNKLDPRDRAAISSDLIALTGRLRETYLGPGAMTQQEYDRLYAAIGDPTKLTSFNAIELAKLNAVKRNLGVSLAEKAKNVAGLNEWPLTKEEALVNMYRKKGYSLREAGELAAKVLDRKK